MTSTASRFVRGSNACLVLPLEKSNKRSTKPAAALDAATRLPKMLRICRLLPTDDILLQCKVRSRSVELGQGSRRVITLVSWDQRFFDTIKLPGRKTVGEDGVGGPFVLAPIFTALSF